MTSAHTLGGQQFRVVFLVSQPDGVGGTERATFQLTAALAKVIDLDVSIAGVFRQRDDPHFREDVEVPIHYAVDSRGTAVPVDLPAEAVRRLLAERSPHVVVATSPDLLALVRDVAPNGCRIIDIEHRATAARGSSVEPILRHAAHADALVSLVPAGERWLERQLGPDRPLLVTIPNLIPDTFVPRSSLRQPMIVAAGRLVRSKQFGHVVSAFGSARRDGWRLRIFGDGPERPTLQRLVTNSGLHDAVDLVPFVPSLQHELAKSSMLVMSSVAEGMPLVALEALATGVPIVSYDCPVGPRAIIEDGANGRLVPPNDVVALGVAIRSLIDDVDLRSRLGAGALASTARFDAATIAGHWAELIRAVCAAPPRRGTTAAARSRRVIRADLTPPPDTATWVPQGGLLLHIGPHKTGTTAVQSAFVASRDRLRGLGVVYPGTTSAPHGAVMSRLGTRRGWNDAIAPGPIEAWEQLCVETRTAEGTVVVSSEALCHASDEQAGAVPGELRRAPARVVITLRPLEKILPSAWQEYVKSGWTTPFEQFLKHVLEAPNSPDNPTPTFWVRHDHGRLVERWTTVFGPEGVLVVVGDPQEPRLLLDAFEDAVGLPRGLLAVGAGPTNRSLTLVEAELLRQINSGAHERIAWNDFNRLLRLGGTANLVEQRTPPIGEPRLELPAWALERAREHGQRAIEVIGASGARIVGDLGQLAPTTPLTNGDEATTHTTAMVPVDAVLELLVGIADRSELNASWGGDPAHG